MEIFGSLLILALFFYIMTEVGRTIRIIHASRSKGFNKPNHKDPVCGIEVDMDKGYGEMYQGQLYRFCSRECLDKFDKNQEQYLNTQRVKL